MKKTLFITAIALLTLSIVSCNKEEENNNNTTPQDTTQTTVQKHNVELKYGMYPSSQWQHIEMDTIRKYNADKDVDTIFMIPEMYDQYATLSTSQLNMVIPKLRERHNVNPNKVFGKGDLKLNYYSVDQNPEIVRFLADTLKYHLVYDNQPNSK